MIAALPVLHEENVRRALPELTLTPRGCFLLCVGRSEAVRARVEDALAERLGAGKAVVRGSLAGNRADLWRAMVREREGSGAAPEDTVLSFRLGEADPADLNRFGRLNMGREARVLGRLRLMLWLDGFEELNKFQREAPDLWVVRSDVQFYLSREDFEVPEVVGEVVGYDAKIADVDARLGRPWAHLASEDRIRLLTRKANYLAEQGRPEEALSLVEEAERLCGPSEVETKIIGRLSLAQLFSARCRVMTSLGRSDEVGTISDQALRRAEANGDTELACRANEHLAKSRKAAQAYGESILVYCAQSRALEHILAKGPPRPGRTSLMLVNRGGVWASLGVLDRAESDVNDAERAALQVSDDQSARRMALSGVAERRADISTYRGRVTEGLAQQHLECTYKHKIQAWVHLNDALRAVSAAYRRLGLLGDARDLATEALGRLGRVGDPSHRGGWLSWLGDVAADADNMAEAALRYQAATETYVSLRDAASSPTRAATFALAEAELHGERWPKILSPDAALPHREQAERLLLDVLIQPVATGFHMQAQLALGRLYRDANRFDDSAARLTTYLDWARADQGPARAARASIELARTSLARRDPTAALLHITAAQADLNREEPLYRSRFVQKEILVVAHEAHHAQGDFTAAHQALTEALSVVRAEGLRLEELDVIQHLAVLPPTPGAADHRLAAANEAITLAREVMWFSEEARALATLATLEIDAGRPETARGPLEEATWIAASVGPEALRRRIREIAGRLPAAS